MQSTRFLLTFAVVVCGVSVSLAVCDHAQPDSADVSNHRYSEKESRATNGNSKLRDVPLKLMKNRCGKFGKHSFQKLLSLQKLLLRFDIENPVELVKLERFWSMDGPQLEWQVKELFRNANFQFDSHEITKAYNWYSWALDYDPDDKVKLKASILCNRAAAALKLRKYQVAMEDCDKMLEMDKNNVEAMIYRGLARMELKDYDAAVGDFQNAYERVRHSFVCDLLKDAQTMQAKSKGHLQDYYKILGVGKDANDETLTLAYWSQAFEQNPNKNGGTKGAEENFKKLTEAYTTLIDQETRKQYDTSVDQKDERKFVLPYDIDIKVDEVFNDKHPELLYHKRFN